MGQRHNRGGGRTDDLSRFFNSFSGASYQSELYSSDRDRVIKEQLVGTGGLDGPL